MSSDARFRVLAMGGQARRQAMENFDRLAYLEGLAEENAKRNSRDVVVFKCNTVSGGRRGLCEPDRSSPSSVLFSPAVWRGPQPETPGTLHGRGPRSDDAEDEAVLLGMLPVPPEVRRVSAIPSTNSSPLDSPLRTLQENVVRPDHGGTVSQVRLSRVGSGSGATGRTERARVMEAGDATEIHEFYAFDTHSSAILALSTSFRESAFTSSRTNTFRSCSCLRIAAMAAWSVFGCARQRDARRTG